MKKIILTHNQVLDIDVSVGFGMAVCGFLFHQFWWIMGGTAIFVISLICFEAEREKQQFADELRRG